MVYFDSIFKVFISSIKREMRVKSPDFEWKNLLQIGANGVANHLQVKEKMVVKPSVNTLSENESEVLGHTFKAETSRFHYIGTSSGRDRHFYKTFGEIHAEFWKQREEEAKKGKMSKAEKARLRAEKITSQRILKKYEKGEASHLADEAYKKGNERTSESVKDKRERKKQERLNRRSQSQSPPLSPSQPEETEKPEETEEPEDTEESEETEE